MRTPHHSIAAAPRNARELAAYLKRQAARVDRALQQRLPRASARPARLHAAIRYSLFPGGKRLRPILCLAAADAAAGARLSRPAHDAALLAALSLELLHTYTLIHDDLPCMDDDDLRRGKPTVHIMFGEANAVLAGDALQAMAFACLADADAVRPGVGGHLVAELARAAGSQGVVGGQVEDIAAVGKRPTPGLVTYIHRRKTADLFAAATRMGAIAVGARAAQVHALGRYGMALGEAFQITDDLLDEAQAAPAAAKPPAELSCLSVMSRAAATRKAARLIERARTALAAFRPAARQPLEAIAAAALHRQS